MDPWRHVVSGCHWIKHRRFEGWLERIYSPNTLQRVWQSIPCLWISVRKRMLLRVGDWHVYDKVARAVEYSLLLDSAVNTWQQKSDKYDHWLPWTPVDIALTGCALGVAANVDGHARGAFHCPTSWHRKWVNVHDSLQSVKSVTRAAN